MWAGAGSFGGGLDVVCGVVLRSRRHLAPTSLLGQLIAEIAHVIGEDLLVDLAGDFDGEGQIGRVDGFACGVAQPRFPVRVRFTVALVDLGDLDREFTRVDGQGAADLGFRIVPCDSEGPLEGDGRLVGICWRPHPGASYPATRYPLPAAGVVPPVIVHDTVFTDAGNSG